MIEKLLRSHVDPARLRLAAQLAGFGLGGGVLTALSMALGIAAAAGVAAHFYLAGLALFVLNRVAAILAGAQSGVVAIAVPDLVVYAALTFGFAIADPSRALAASFLLFGLVVLAGCAVMFDAPRKADRGAAVLAAAVIFAAVVLCCIAPERFSLIAYLFGLLCFAFAGTFAASSLARRP